MWSSPPHPRSWWTVSMASIQENIARHAKTWTTPSPTPVRYQIPPFPPTSKILLTFPPTTAPEQHAASRAHLLFSCAQRAHANYIENQPSALAAMLIAGLQYPRTAAALGAFWTVNRYIYMKGYVSDKGPKGRLRGGAFILAQLGLIGLCVVEGLGMAGWL